ncbi:hypothetical protein [Psychromonas arctica]|uniref:hypothetical protein n=1 Tax=Psychromonas arctica TaxID=168275 RepID=UPI0003FC98FE|nr:hypothetical protein [Psychromonas arctica]
MPTSYEHQLDTLLERFNFHFTKNQIKEVIPITSRSKDLFKNDVLTVIADNQCLKSKINELGLLALQLDTRQVEIFDITVNATKSALDSLFTEVQLTTEALINDAFPFPIEDKSKLTVLRAGTVYPILADTVAMGTDLYNRLVVCTVIDKEVEESVPVEHLSQTGLQHRNSHTTYTMKRQVRTQLFHAVYWCCNLSKLILSVDRNTLSLTVTQEQLFVLRRFLMAKRVDPGIATNVFGVIEPLYNAADGYVTKLGHVTTDGNPVRIPLKGNQKCLKEDHYHKAGEGGGHVQAKFAVAKKWVFKIDDSSRTVDIEVGLMGQPKMLDTAQPLSDFSINKSKRLEDLSFAIDKVLSLVPNS